MASILGDCISHKVMTWLQVILHDDVFYKIHLPPGAGPWRWSNMAISFSHITKNRRTPGADPGFSFRGGGRGGGGGYARTRTTTSVKPGSKSLTAGRSLEAWALESRGFWCSLSCYLSLILSILIQISGIKKQSRSIVFYFIFIQSCSNGTHFWDSELFKWYTRPHGGPSGRAPIAFLIDDIPYRCTAGSLRKFRWACYALL